MKDLIREKYLSRIRPFFNDTEMIKVLTGVRRCGKSTIMNQIINELISGGIAEKDIAYFDLDSKKYHKLRTIDELECEVDCILGNNLIGKYLFIDEIQNIPGFEDVINAYRNEGVSVFVTGSNSYLLSGELVTKLTGRFIEFRIYPFSFSEIRDYHHTNGIDFEPDSAFDRYIRYGGYPRIQSYYDESDMEIYIQSVISETINKDILSNNRIRDREMMIRVLRFVLSSPGAEISSSSIQKFLKSEKVNTLPSTVNRYLSTIFASKLADKCERFDISGKRALSTLYKSYVADPSIYMLYPTVRGDFQIGRMMENIVHTELLSRGYHVSVGKLRNSEVDFIVSNGRSRAYIQVSYLISTQEIEEREEKPLLDIRDAYPKYIISMDPVTIDNNGIRRLNLIKDFLLGDGFSMDK